MQHVRFSPHRSPVLKLGDPHITLSPKFQLSPPPSPETPSSSDPLIPGLPDDVALICLLRLPFSSHPAARCVNRRWRRLLASKDLFFTKRKQFNFHDPWLFTFAFHRCTGKVQFQVLDLNNFSWHTIPAMPARDRACPRGFGLVGMGAALMVCGGMVSDVECPLHLVMRYEIHQNRWILMRRMITPRSFFAGGIINGLIYVAGGFSADQYELSSAEVFEPGFGIWRPIANMGTNMACYDSAVLDGKLYVTEGWVWPFLFSPRGQVYDPGRDTWEGMAAGMREGWTGLSVVVEGRLLVVSEHERMKVKVYDAERDEWGSVEGEAMPERIRKPFSVSSSGWRIFVVGRGMHVAVGHVRRVRGGSREAGLAIEWQEIVPPATFMDLTPSSTQVLFA